MRIELPDTFDVAPLIDALNLTARAQGYRLKGEHDGREVLVRFVPDTTAPLLDVPRTPGKVVPLHRARRQRSAVPQRAA